MRVYQRLGGVVVGLGLALARLAPPAFAEGPGSLNIAFPTDGAVVRTTDIPVNVGVSDFNVACDQAGRPDKPGVGHIHVMLDGMTMAQLSNFYCSQQFWISGQGLQAGQHVLIIDLSTNTHLDLEETAQTVSFLYQPGTAPAGLPDAGPRTGAAVAVTAPASGARVGPQFKLDVRSSNFSPSCDLEGKRNVVGFGHYHVFVDMDPSMMMMDMGMDHVDTGDMDMQEHMDMMAMPGMISMPCVNSIPVDLSGWPSGSHTLAVELVQNDHTPLEEPGQAPKSAMITINLDNPFMP